jgi:hypothetical protein
LRDPTLLVRLIGHAAPTRPARLHGFRREEPAGTYPYVVPAADGVVDGMLLEGLDAPDMAALDRYESEGDLYQRCDVVAEVDGAAVACAVYVGLRPAPRS